MIEEHTAAAATPPGASSRLTRAEWGLLLVLAAVQFTHIVDFVILMPLGPELQGALQITAKQFGWMVASYALGASLTGLLAARLLDRFDRKRAVLVLYAGFTLGTLLCAAAPGFVTLVLARAVAGGFAGVLAAGVLAIIGDAFPDARRGRAMGIIMSAFSVASIVGVPAGLILANGVGWRAPFVVLGVLSTAVWVLAWRALPELRGHMVRHADEASGLWAVLVQPAHVRAYTLMATLVLGSFTIIPYLSIYLVNNVGRDKTELAYVWLCGGIATLLTMWIFGWLSDRFGKLLVFRVMAVVTLVPTWLLTHLPPVSLAWTLAATTLFMVTSSGRMVPAVAMITGSSLRRYRGSFLSVNASIQQFAAAVAPLLGGAMLGDTETGTPLTGFSTVGIFAVTAMLATLFLAGRLHAPVDEPETTALALPVAPVGEPEKNGNAPTQNTERRSSCPAC